MEDSKHMVKKETPQSVQYLVNRIVQLEMLVAELLDKQDEADDSSY